MTPTSLGTPPFHRLIPILLALPIALAVTMIKPALSIPFLIGGLILIIAFLAPEAGLYLLVFSMLLGPELIVGAMGTGASLGRGVTLRFDDLVLSLVGCGWLARTAVSDNTTKYIRTPLNRPIMLYTAACAFATFMGILFGNVKPFSGFFFLLKYYEYFFLFFMAVNIVQTKKQVTRLLVASFVTCAIVSLYALAQIPSGQRVSAPFEGIQGEPNTLGGYLLFMMSVIAGLLLTPGATTKKLPLFGLLGLAGIAFQATLSRASFLGAAVVMCVVLELARRKSPALFGALLIGGLGILFVLPNSVTERITYTFTQPYERGQVEIGSVKIDTSTSDRLRSWGQAIEYFYRSPIWGTGVTGGPFMDAMFPRVLTETGLLGMTAFLFLLWSIFHLGITGYRGMEDPFIKGLALGFLLGFLGLLFHAIGANTFIIVRIMEPFWLCAALLTKCLLMEDARHARELQVVASGDSQTMKSPLKRRFLSGRRSLDSKILPH